MKKYNVIIVGGGAAGLMAAHAALSRGRTVAIFDMGTRPLRKVATSGGGRCNFTNSAVSRDRYFGKNPDFVRSALANFTPFDMLDWMAQRGLHAVEKSPGQYFCETGALDVVDALMSDAADADIFLDTKITNIEKSDSEFLVYAKSGAWTSESIIIATGGMSYPTLGPSDFGYMIAKKFGHKIIPIAPGLVGLKTSAFPSDLAGISLPVRIVMGRNTVSDSLLFTHVGIGGPAAYRASLYNVENGMMIDFAPGINVLEFLQGQKSAGPKKSMTGVLAQIIPVKLAKFFALGTDKNIAEHSDLILAQIAAKINKFEIAPGAIRRLGLDNAEITIGGVSTEFISSKTMESKLVPGLFFAGEVLDIAGDLGGFNLHFAWASGVVAGQNA